MAVAEGTIGTILRKTRRWINDRGMNPTYTNSELLEAIATAYDRVIEDVFTTPLDKPFMQFDLPLVINQQEYLLPAGIGHVYSIAVLTSGKDSTDNTISQIVQAHIPMYNQNDVRWPGYLWNPPILKLARAPSAESTVRITFLPRAMDYLHEGLIAASAIEDVGYANWFRIAYNAGDTGTMVLSFQGQQTGALNLTSSAVLIRNGLEALGTITQVTVLLEDTGWTVRFVTPGGIQPPIEVYSQPINGTVTIEALDDDTYPAPTNTTLVLDSVPSIGRFDPRPNAYIGGRLRILETGIPTGYVASAWIERDIIEYDPATHTITLSSPLDYIVWAEGTTVKYEILPFSDPTILNVAAIEAARNIHSMGGNVKRRAVLESEYERALSTARKQVADRNRALPKMPTPSRYLRESGPYKHGIYGTTSTGMLDRFNLV